MKLNNQDNQDLWDEIYDILEVEGADNEAATDGVMRLLLTQGIIFEDEDLDLGDEESHD